MGWIISLCLGVLLMYPWLFNEYFENVNVKPRYDKDIKVLHKPYLHDNILQMNYAEGSAQSLSKERALWRKPYLKETGIALDYLRKYKRGVIVYDRNFVRPGEGIELKLVNGIGKNTRWEGKGTFKITGANTCRWYPPEGSTEAFKVTAIDEYGGRTEQEIPCLGDFLSQNGLWYSDEVRLPNWNYSLSVGGKDYRNGQSVWLKASYKFDWIERQPAGDVNKNWYSVASDDDGSNLIACVNGGRLYTSSDGGVNWTERQPAGNADKDWRGVASDSDGSNLIASVFNGRLYTSSDGGASWTERRPA
ncbi:hypothetical protein DRH14_05435, partial [Candidatus Shapirobacteria bacterium]